jgi:hypothetical protein
MRAAAGVLVVSLAACGHGPSPARPGSVVAHMALDARRIDSLCPTSWVGQFLDGAGALPKVTPRKQVVGGQARWVDESLYYEERYGSPLVYCRALEVAGLEGVAGQRILDYGYGAIGQLRLLAGLGAEVTGLDVDATLPEIYAHDQGPYGKGTVRLLSGFFPRDPAIRAQVGEGYRLIVAKNVLKEGYVHRRKPNPKFDAGVDDLTLVRALYGILVPSGRLVIYNLSPAANGPGLPYRSHADAPLPFPRALLEEVGFRVIAYDLDDTGPVRQMARALRWDQEQPPMDVEHDLFARYTVLERP